MFCEVWSPGTQPTVQGLRIHWGMKIRSVFFWEVLCWISSFGYVNMFGKFCWVSSDGYVNMLPWRHCFDCGMAWDLDMRWGMQTKQHQRRGEDKEDSYNLQTMVGVFKVSTQYTVSFLFVTVPLILPISYNSFHWDSWHTVASTTLRHHQQPTTATLWQAWKQQMPGAWRFHLYWLIAKTSL